MFLYVIFLIEGVLQKFHIDLSINYKLDMNGTLKRQLF